MAPGRSCSQCTTGEKFCLLVVVVGLLSALGFALYGIIKDHFHTADSCYLFVFSVNCCFALVYVVKGMRNEDPYDLAILVLSVAPPLIYIIYNYAVSQRTVVKEIRLILGVVFAPGIAGFGVYYFWKYARSKNFMRRYGVEPTMKRTENSEAIKANRELQSCLRTMLPFYFLLGVNLQCDISVAVFILTSGYAVEVESWTIHNIMMLISFFFVVIFAFAGSISGHLSVKHESMCLVRFFCVTSVLLAAAGLYLLVQAAKDLHRDDTDHTLSKVAVFTAVLMLFIRIITFIGSYLTVKDFGKGLKQAVSGYVDPERLPLRNENWNNQCFTDAPVQYERTSF